MKMYLTSFREHVAQIRSDRFLLTWNISLLVTLVLPLIIFGVARAGMSQGDENRNQERNQDDNYHSWWQFWKSNNDDNGNARQGEEDGAPWWCKSFVVL